jgi:hypothetical protein
METLPARRAKNSFERLINFPRFASFQMEKRGEPVIVVMSIEEYELSFPILTEAKIARLRPSRENT